MPIRGGSPPAPARSKDDSEDEDGDGKSHVTIPQMTSWAPAIFVPAHSPEEEDQAKPPEARQAHQQLNDLLAECDAHAAIVRSNHAWMVGREARRLQQAAVQAEVDYMASSKSLPRSKRLPPTEEDEKTLLWSMATVPVELQKQPQRRHSNPNSIPTAVGGNAAFTPYEVPPNFSFREVQALFPDQRDTPREHAVTSILNVARNAIFTADWYANAYQKRRNDKITSYVGERAKSFVPGVSSLGDHSTGQPTTATGAAAATPATSTAGGPKRRVSFAGSGKVDDDGGMPMDID
ncbi:uncharacterized protein PG998_009397 [Apiospora kogelbergensis]|uniref:uncharacterized protein n=1 Tax=Apiospora kogelbergensis TaxID=1337665 RepID=UPI00312E7E73